MNLSEILKAKGIDDKTIADVIADMKANKVYTASEENLDVRYGKLKTDHDGTVNQLTEAQNLIAELKKSSKSNEGMQQKIAEYEQQVAQLQAELDQTKLESEVKVELLSSKVKDVDYMIFKLKEKGDLALDENGKIKGWDDKLAALKTQYPSMFESDGKKQYQENKLPTGTDNPAISKEQFTSMSYEARVALKNENEELYKQLRNQ